MARKNRKHGYEGSRIMFWGVALGMLSATLALVYLGLYNTCDQIGARIKQLETNQVELRKHVVNEEHNWAIARAAHNLERLMARHGIVMSWPAPHDIIRLRPPPPADPVHYAWQDGTTRRD